MIWGNNQHASSRTLYVYCLSTAEKKRRQRKELYILSWMLPNNNCFFWWHLYLVCRAHPFAQQFVFRNVSASQSPSAFYSANKFCEKKTMWQQIPGSLYQYKADCWQDLVQWLWWGMGEIYSFLYQVMSPVVKQCDRKSVQLWWLSSVLCPSTFSFRSLSKAHLKCTVCSLWMTHPQENELYGAGSLANKHFTICRVYWSTLLTYSLNPGTTNTNWQTSSVLFCL